MKYQTEGLFVARVTLVGEVGCALGAFDRDYLKGIPSLSRSALPFGELTSNAVGVSVQTSRTLCQLRVEAVEVIVHHAAHRVVRSDEVHRVLHRLYPAIGVGLAVTLEVERYDFLLEEVVDGRRVELVLQGLIGEGALVGECPTSTLAVAFVPPSIEDGEVEDAVHLGLFARSTRGFEGARRCVHPDVYAGDEFAGQAHVVVLQEDDLTKELRTTADLEDVLDESLATTIGRVRLTGEEELYRVLGVVDDALQTL